MSHPRGCRSSTRAEAHGLTRPRASHEVLSTGRYGQLIASLLPASWVARSSASIEAQRSNGSTSPGAYSVALSAFASILELIPHGDL